MSRIREATHVELSFLSFFETPTVADMAKSIETASQARPGLQAAASATRVQGWTPAASPMRSNACGSLSSWGSAAMPIIFWK